MRSDKRNQQTEKALVDSLIDLMKEKNFNDISVTDITRSVGINRGTFYIHFNDKDDLLFKIETELLEKLKQSLDSVLPEAEAIIQLRHDNYENLPYKLVIKTLNQFYDDRNVVAALMSKNGDASFINKIKELFQAEIRSEFDGIKEGIVYDKVIPRDYIEEMILNNLMTIIIHWLTKANPEKPEVVADIILRYREISPQDMINLN